MGVETPNEVLMILSLGPKFATVPVDTPILDLASDVEAIIAQKLPRDNREQPRGEALYTITKFSRQQKHLNRIHKYLQRAATKAKEFLKNNREIMVSNSDKDSVTIISKKSEYYAKIRTLLSDLQAFTPLNQDPTKTIENKVNNFLDKLYHANYICDQLKESLKTWNTIPPRLFRI